MKKLILFVIILASVKLSAQNCPIEPWVEDKMLIEVEKYVLANILSDSNHLYFDSIYPPQAEIDEVLSKISSVFTSLSQEDFYELTRIDSVFQLDIFSIPFGIVAKVDSVPDWLLTLRIDSLQSGNTEIDSIINFYNLQYWNDYYLTSTNSSHVIFKKSNGLLNYIALAKKFELLNEIQLAEPRYLAFIPEGCFYDFEIQNDSIFFTISNSINPPQGDSYWNYFINQNCEAELIDKLVNPCGFNSISNAGLPTLSFYPNPTKESIFINSTDLIGKDYQIISLAGKVLQKGVLSAERTINLSQLSRGIYFIQVENNLGKVIKD